MKYLAISLMCLALIACTSAGGYMPHGSGTQTVLKEDNYVMLYPAAHGTSSGFRLLGVIPFSSPTHGKALSDLYSKVPTQGKATSLVNMSQEYSSAYFILFSIPKITVTADVIEFNKALEKK